MVFNFIVALVLTKGGFITEVMQNRITEYHFATVYKSIERENWNYALVHQRVLLALIRTLNIRVVRFVIDDTFLYRAGRRKS